MTRVSHQDSASLQLTSGASTQCSLPTGDGAQPSTSGAATQLPSATTGQEFGFLYSPEVGASVEVSEDHVESRKGRKRETNPENWKHKHVKRPGLRKNAPHLDIQSLTKCCKKECLSRFSNSHLSDVRGNFEGLYYEQQNIYLTGLLRRHETKKTSGHKRKLNPTTTLNGKRLGRPRAEDSKFTFEYYIHDEKGLDIKVCQKAFCGVHAFGPKRLRVLREKITDAMDGSTVVWDKRGKHHGHVKVSEAVRDTVREHIRSYPARSSHYSRSDNTGRVYLPPDLSIARLYRDFLEKHDPEYVQLEEDNRQRVIQHQPIEPLRKPICTLHFYHDIFVKEFNIYFGYPRSDTCDTCDSFTAKIHDAASTGSAEVDDLKQDLEAHKALAEEGYKAFRYDQDLCHLSWEHAVNN